MKYTEELNRTRVYDGFSKIDKIEYKDETGRTFNRELNVRKSGVAALVYNSFSDTYIFVEQFRVGSNTRTLEIPAGLLDKDGEDPIDAIKREIVEETGCTPIHISRLINAPKYYTAIGSSNEQLELYLCIIDEYKISKEGGIGNENIIIHELSSDDVVKMYHQGNFIDGKTIIAILSHFREKLF